MLYLYPRLQLHVQYQPRSDMFAHSLTSTPTTITTPSTVKPTASPHHQQLQTPTTTTAWPQECHVTRGFGCRQLGPSTQCKLSIFIVVFVVFEVLTSFFLLFLGYLLPLQQQRTMHAYALLPIQIGCEGGWLRLIDPREVPGGPSSRVPTR